MTNIKKLITDFRNGPNPSEEVREWKHGPKMKALEAKYGKYVYVPLDIPPIRPNDPAAFKQWWLEASKPIKKTKPNFLDNPNDPSYLDPLFTSINSPGSENDSYEVNVRQDIYERFPELEAHLHHFPFDVKPEFTIWSSMRAVKVHKDGLPVRDLPCTFRVMLYDENPDPTLYLKEYLPHEHDCLTQIILPDGVIPGSFPVPRVEGTTAFAWNNIRLNHYSLYDPRYMKCLMLLHNERFNIDKFDDLLERSIKKYEEHVVMSDHPASIFFD